MSLGVCPVCGSVIKSERGLVGTVYGASVICTDNWHWVSAPALPAPKGFEWNADDDLFMWQMDLAFQKSQFHLMEEYKYLA